VDEESPEKSDAKSIALELRNFLLAEAPGVTNSQLFHREESAFAGFPKLRRFVAFVIIDRRLADVPWDFGKAEWVGVDPRLLRAIISRKSRQKLKYANEMNECWLLICGSGATPADGWGPERLSKDELSNPALVAAAQDSGFQKVICWESVEKWDREL
jgi:hypothetical protein